jgi:GNAT superfamily N-acetyltransferase
VPGAWSVRQIRDGEGLRLRALRLHALADAPAAFGSTLAREQAFAEEVWHQRAADGAAGFDRVTVIAERDERWVGMASGLAAERKELAQPGPILVGMFVDHSARRLGIGEALVENVKTWARSRGENRLHLWAVSTNAPALALYRRCGFEPSDATRPVSHTPGLIELQLVAQLAP